MRSTPRSSPCRCGKPPTPPCRPPATPAPRTPTCASSGCAARTSASATAGSRASTDDVSVGIAVRVVARRHVGLREQPRRHRRRGGPARPGGRRRWPGSPGRSTPSRSSWPTSRSTPTSPGCRPTTSTRSASTRPTRWRCSPSGASGCSPSDDVDHVDVTLQQALEGKFYADTAGTTTTQQRVRLQPQADRRRGSTPAAASRRCARSPLPVGRGWEYLTGERLRLGRRARAAARAAGREGQGAAASSPAATTWSSTRPTSG